MTTAIYPGTFDPLTLGHEDLIRRASTLFEKIVVGIARSREKHPFFRLEERIHIAIEVLSDYRNVSVKSFSGLLKDFVYNQNGTVIIRGLRTALDFEYEFQMAGVNRELMPGIETFFMIPSVESRFISGSIVREIALSGGDTSRFVPPSVVHHLSIKAKEYNSSYKRQT